MSPGAAELSEEGQVFSLNDLRYFTAQFNELLEMGQKSLVYIHNQSEVMISDHNICQQIIDKTGINIFREEFNSRCFKMQNILQISHHFTNQITFLLLFSPFIILKSEEIDRRFVIFQPDRISCQSLRVWLLLCAVHPLGSVLPAAISRSCLAPCYSGCRLSPSSQPC